MRLIKKRKELLTALVEEKLELREVAKAFQEEFIDRIQYSTCVQYASTQYRITDRGELSSQQRIKKLC